jgi:hypothetical protein
MDAACGGVAMNYERKPAADWVTPTRWERFRIRVTMNLLAAAWRTLPRSHPAYRGIFDAACAIRDPVLSENLANPLPTDGVAEDEAEQFRVTKDGMLRYANGTTRAATLAEKAMWRFIETHLAGVEGSPQLQGAMQSSGAAVDAESAVGTLASNAPNQQEPHSA